MTGATLNREAMDRLDRHMAGFVERGDVPGVVTLVSRGDIVGVGVHGVLAPGGQPMARDTVFRIASMTKPIAAAAAMILVEEGRLRLDEPVERLLPELANRTVLRRVDGPLDDVVPADRAITLRDVLTSRMGFGILFSEPESTPILQAADEIGLGTLGPWPPDCDQDEWLRRLATLPLMAQPGERWLYNTAYWVLAALISRAAGEPFADFLQERIFGPLDMRDTGFFVPGVKRARLAGQFQQVASGGFEPVEAQHADACLRMPAFPSGGGELVSTIDDYHAFARMLLGRGRLGGVRLLSPASVAVMTMNHLTVEQSADAALLLEGHGWGYGLQVITRRDGLASNPGRFGWFGGYGTSYFSDPELGLTGIALTQVMAFQSNLHADFQTMAYAAAD